MAYPTTSNNLALLASSSITMDLGFTERERRKKCRCSATTKFVRFMSMGRWKECTCYLWSQLPEELLEKILASLSVESLCRSKRVCKKWNALFSSTKFITSEWSQAAPNKNPRLFLGYCRTGKPYQAYCFSTRTWRSAVSFSFLHEKVRDVAITHATYEGSATGLFLVNIFYTDRCTENAIVQSVRAVCNPLTQAFLRLPPMLSITIAWKVGIVAGTSDQNSQAAYKVVAVGWPPGMIGDLIVEIYDSFLKSWRIAGHLPRNNVRGLDAMILHQNFIFCVVGQQPLQMPVVGQQASQMRVIGFNTVDGTSILVPLPTVPDGRTFFAFLLSCRSRSRVLLAGLIINVGRYDLQDLRELVLWELGPALNVGLSWKEIAKMPPSMRDIFKATNLSAHEIWLHCSGVGDNVCFAHKFSQKVIVYSMTRKSWSYIYRPLLDTYFRLYEFEPRPDLKVL